MTPPPNSAKFIEDQPKFSLLHNWSEFYLELNGAIKQFPKRDRHGIGERLEQISFDFLDYLVLASKKKGESRMNLLEKMDRELVKKKILVRLSCRIKAMPEAKYISLEKRMIEIGRMLGGWIKSEKEKMEKLKNAADKKEKLDL